MEEKKKNSIFNNNNEKPLSPVTFRDLILFKEEILKEMKIYQNKIDNTITKNYENSTKLIELSNSKLYNYEIDKALFMKQIEFIEEKNKIISLIEEKNNELKNHLMVNDLHTDTCQKELDNACFKYDKVIVDNLLIPGLVGKGCKFPFFKEYINDIQGQIDIAVSQNKQNANNLSANKTNTDEKMRQINTKIKKLEYESKQFTTEKTILIENKFNEMIESLNNQLTSVTGEYFKSKYELKDKVAEVKNIASLIIEENKKMNNKTLTEFEKLKKSFKYIRKSIVELSTLLSSETSFSGSGKFNKNIAFNRQQIIQNFNSMVIGLMKDVAKGNSEFDNEINNVLYPKKKVGSVIKQYIEGKIQAEDTKYIEEKNKSKKGFNKQKTFVDILNRNSYKKKINSTPKKEDLYHNSNRLNSDNSKTNGNNYPKLNRYVSLDINSTTKNNLIPNNNNDILNKNKSNILNKNRSNIHIIKEEENNKSKYNDNSFSDDFDEEFTIEEDNILKNKYSKNIDDDKNYNLNLKVDNNIKKDKKKLFFRAQTSNFDNKKFDFGNNNNDHSNFKLLLKAQENLERKKVSFKTENPKKNRIKNDIINEDKNKNDNKDLNKDKNKDINEKKIINNKNDILEVIDLKSNKTDDKDEVQVTSITSIDKPRNFENNNIIENENKENEVDINDIKSKNKDKHNIDIETDNINTEKNRNDNENKTKNKVKNENIIKKNSINKEEHSSTKNQKEDNLEINNNTNTNTSPIPIKSKNMFNTKNDFKKVQLNQNNLKLDTSKKDNIKFESLFLNYSKNNKKHNNIIKKDNILSFSDTFNNNIINKNNQYNTQDNIYNNNKTLTITNKKRPLSIMNSCQTRPASKFRIKSNNNNFFNDDIYINKNLINNINYCKDEDIIDKPLLINQKDFKVDNIKGNLENKILELEYFTKRKLDELVREIRNFIPIHFNAYIKE